MCIDSPGGKSRQPLKSDWHCFAVTQWRGLAMRQGLVRAGPSRREGCDWRLKHVCIGLDLTSIIVTEHYHSASLSPRQSRGSCAENSMMSRYNPLHAIIELAQTPKRTQSLRLWESESLQNFAPKLTAKVEKKWDIFRLQVACLSEGKPIFLCQHKLERWKITQNANHVRRESHSPCFATSRCQLKLASCSRVETTEAVVIYVTL